MTLFLMSFTIATDYNTDVCWNNNNMTSNSNIYLTSDIISTDATQCFSLEKNLDNVTIDCQGYSITNTNYGNNNRAFNSYSGEKNSIIVENCYINDFGSHGFWLANFTNWTIRNVVFNNNQMNHEASDITIISIDNNFNDGLLIEDCTFNTTNTENGSWRNIDYSNINNVIIRNNKFYAKWNGTDYVGGVSYLRTGGTSEYSTNFDFYNNEFYNGCRDVWTNQYYLSLIAQDDSKFINVNVYNNTLINLDGGFFRIYDGSTEIYAVENLNFYDNTVTNANASSNIAEVYSVNNLNFYDNNFTNIGNNISQHKNVGSFNNVNNGLVYGNTVTNLKDKSFATALYFYNSNNITAFNNRFIDFNTPNIHNAYVGIYFDTASNSTAYNNYFNNLFGIGVYNRNINDNIIIHSNQVENSFLGTFIDIRDSSDVEVYNQTISNVDNLTSCIRLRGNSPNNYIHNNICEDSNQGLLFDNSGTYTNNIITNNTFTNNDIGINFNDLGEIIDLSSNNIYANDVNVQAGTNVVLIGNYYNDGDVNSTDGFCLIQPYIEGNVTDNFAFCCLNGFNDGCSYTPDENSNETGYVPSYVNEDIPKATVNAIVKAIISFSLMIIIIVFVIGYSYFKRNIIGVK